MFDALAARTPVIASDVKALAEVIRDGENGFVLPPGDQGALLRCLTRLHDEPPLRRRLGAGALRSVASLSPGRTARITAGVYDEVLRERGQPAATSSRRRV